MSKGRRLTSSTHCEDRAKVCSDVIVRIASTGMPGSLNILIESCAAAEALRAMRRICLG